MKGLGAADCIKAEFDMAKKSGNTVRAKAMEDALQYITVAGDRRSKITEEDHLRIGMKICKFLKVKEGESFRYKTADGVKRPEGISRTVLGIIDKRGREL